jgi:hypothetical protein
LHTVKKLQLSEPKLGLLEDGYQQHQMNRTEVSMIRKVGSKQPGATGSSGWAGFIIIYTIKAIGRCPAHLRTNPRTSPKTGGRSFPHDLVLCKKRASHLEDAVGWLLDRPQLALELEAGAA